jgi:MoaA/NifB/PqqE/SkfB family radical SAM enzyme
MPSDAWNSLRIDNISSRKEFEAYINDCGNYAKAKKLGFKFNPYIRESTCKKNYCISPWKHLYLNTNGDISPCCIQPIIFGNICNDNFDEIWNGDKINQFRNEMLLGNYDSKCLTCCLSWGLPYE